MCCEEVDEVKHPTLDIATQVDVLAVNTILPSLTQQVGIVFDTSVELEFDSTHSRIAAKVGLDLCEADQCHGLGGCQKIQKKRKQREVKF